MDRELVWLEERIDAARSAASWDTFCDSQKPLGDHYRKYMWMKKHWEFIKERGFLLMRTIELPGARAYTDLFESACIVKQEYLSKRGGTVYRAPTGFVYIGESGIEPSIHGHYGGKRSLDPTRTYGDGTPIRQHFGATWYVCYVKPKFELPCFPSGRNFELQAGSLEAIKREDGVLIVSRGQSSIGGTWVALLDEGDSLESLLSSADQEFLARERQAEIEAFGIEARV